MPSLDQSIRAALVNAALAVPGFPPLARVALENRTFTPPPGQMWARLTLAPVSGRTLGTNAATTWNVGLFLIDIFVPAGSGVADLDALATAVKSAFRPGSRLVSDGVAAAIDYAERSRAMAQEPEWLQAPITVGWHVFSTSN